MRRLIGSAILLGGMTFGASPVPAQNLDCDGYLTTMVVPEGFCVKVFAKNLPPVRHLLIHPSGMLVASVNSLPGLLLLEVGKNGKVGRITPFGPMMKGTGIDWQGGYLYFASDTLLVRYRWPAPQALPDTILEGFASIMPGAGNNSGAHYMKGLAMARDGSAYLSFGSASDNCQVEDRTPHSPGQWPCRELDTRAGIWHFGPTPAVSDTKWLVERYATGLRNAESLAIDPVTGRMWAATQGRDYLAQTWGFDPEEAANQPAEMLFEIKPGRDYGWPYCMGNWTRALTTQVRSPEYDRPDVNCGNVEKPVLGFPAHWAPMAIVIPQAPLPHGMGRGMFVVFHGSRSRSPLPEDGHYVVFAPLDSTGTPQSSYRIFLHSSEGPGALRASGMAVAPDGIMYVSDDEHAVIYRIEPHPPIKRP